MEVRAWSQLSFRAVGCLSFEAVGYIAMSFRAVGCIAFHKTIANRKPCRKWMIMIAFSSKSSKDTKGSVTCPSVVARIYWRAVVRAAHPPSHPHSLPLTLTHPRILTRTQVHLLQATTIRDRQAWVEAINWLE